MNETTNTTVTGENTSAQEDTKTFTQDELNRIISDRLAKEKTKADTALAQKESELNQRELRVAARERLSDEGLPMELADALNATSPEALDAAITLLRDTINKTKAEAQTLHISGASPANGTSSIPGGGPDVRRAMGLG